MDNWELYYRTHKGKGSNTKTGIPPLTFVSNGDNLTDYKIFGNSGGVGDRTKNLFNINTATPVYISRTGSEEVADQRNLTSDFISVIPGESYIWKAYPTTNGQPWSAVAFYTNGQFVSRTTVQVYTLTFTVPENVNSIRVGSRYMQNGGRGQLELGTDVTSYEPYGFKIPVECGGTTTTIYTEEPILQNESISMQDTGVSIPTIEGENTLSIGTTVQPSQVYIKYGGSSNVSQSLMRYLEYKYDFSKK